MTQWCSKLKTLQFKIWKITDPISISAPCFISDSAIATWFSCAPILKGQNPSFVKSLTLAPFCISICAQITKTVIYETLHLGISDLARLLQTSGFMKNLRISTAHILLKKGKDVSANSTDLFTPLNCTFEKKPFWFFCKVKHLPFTKIQEETMQMESSLEKKRNGCFQNFCTISIKTSPFLLRKNFLETNFINVFQRSFVTITMEKGCLQVWQ